MRVVIKVKNGYGHTEYYRVNDGLDEFVSNIQDAELMSEFEAQQILDTTRQDNPLFPPIWKTATIVPVKIVEL